MADADPPRLLLLLPTSTYRAAAFVRAADALGVRLTVASEQDSAFAAGEPDKLLTMDFDDPATCVAVAQAFHRQHPLAAAFGIDDATAIAAAHIAAALGLPGNPAPATQAAGNKFLQRVRLAEAGVPVPAFEHFATATEAASSTIPFPAVVKPVSLSASRGVQRVDDATTLRDALGRLAAILDEGAPPGGQACLVEEYVPGPEFALEGLVIEGCLTTLALFDKPDPLDGPTFPETIYVTPSRADPEIQQSLVTTAQSACRAIGLRTGPVHIELRHNEGGAWLVELAARPIGGRCGEVLRFGPGGSQSLETVLLAHALGQVEPVPPREPCAAGVMMIPVPRPGTFEAIVGIDRARAVAGVVDVAVTIHRGAVVRPLPEEARYLGFLFSRGDSAAAAEQSLRDAFAELEVRIT
jgi:biotin carboxylase